MPKFPERNIQRGPPGLRRPRVFLSYARQADRRDDQAVSTLRQALEGELHLLTGEPFDIFQDWQDIGWGQDWRRRIQEALDESLFVIPLLTEGLFKSEVCREELELFRAREQSLARDDLFLPLLYARCPSLERHRDDPLVALMNARNWHDWRDLRHEPSTSATYRRAVTRLAERLIEAVERTEPLAAAPFVGNAQRGASLDPKEVALIKAMLALPGFNGQRILSYFSRPERTINIARIYEIRSGALGKNIKPASEVELYKFITPFHRTSDRTGAPAPRWVQPPAYIGIRQGRIAFVERSVTDDEQRTTLRAKLVEQLHGIASQLSSKWRSLQVN